jgi:hypothetical protein
VKRAKDGEYRQSDGKTFYKGAWYDPGDPNLPQRFGGALRETLPSRPTQTKTFELPAEPYNRYSTVPGSSAQGDLGPASPEFYFPQTNTTGMTPKQIKQATAAQEKLKKDAARAAKKQNERDRKAAGKQASAAMKQEDNDAKAQGFSPLKGNDRKRRIKELEDFYYLQLVNSRQAAPSAMDQYQGPGSRSPSPDAGAFGAQMTTQENQVN